MNLGVPKERRPYEYRVGLPPVGVGLFVRHNHTVYVEREAGSAAGFSDEDYARAGAKVVYSEEEVLGRADLVLKFARPLQEELLLMREDQVVAGFLHLAAARQDKFELLRKNKITAIAYEQVVEDDGRRPILAPLSQIGGRMVAQVAARLMQIDHGGRGILLGGVAGVPPAEVVIIGAGVVGETAATTFAALGAHVTVLDVNMRRLDALQRLLQYRLATMLSTEYNLSRASSYADVLVGAVLVPDGRAPIVVTREMVAGMKPRSVIIDMSIDQGGCVETSRPTNHGSPTYIEEGVIHYCVPNMSSVLGRTASNALFYGAYPYLEAIAELGVEGAIAQLAALERGVSTLKGQIMHLQRADETARGAP